MTVGEYLQSPQAIEDATALLAQGAESGLMSPIGFFDATGRLPHLDGVILSPGGCLLLDDMAAADPPRALCRVLLASHRVASLVLP